MEKKNSLSIRQKTSPLKIVLLLTAIYMVLEVLGGYYTQSLALLADAFHMLVDVAALFISLMAFMIAEKTATKRATFGYYRVEILAALFNGAFLLFVSFLIIKEAIEKCFAPTPVKTTPMILIAMGGLIINLIGLYLLRNSHAHHLNLRSAFLHIWSDTLGSIGVIISGVIMTFFDFPLIDPLISIAITLLIIRSSWSLIAETVSILMENAPGHINPDEVRETMQEVPGVIAIHDLHIWSITSHRESLSAHVLIEPAFNPEEVLKQIQSLLLNRFHLRHVTIQVEKDCFSHDDVCV